MWALGRRAALAAQLSSRGDRTRLETTHHSAHVGHAPRTGGTQNVAVLGSSVQRALTPRAHLQVAPAILAQAKLLVHVENLKPARTHRRQRQLELPPFGRARLEAEVDATARCGGLARRAYTQKAVGSVGLLKVDAIRERVRDAGLAVRAALALDGLVSGGARQAEEAVGGKREQLRLRSPQNVPCAAQQRRRRDWSSG